MYAISVRARGSTGPGLLRIMMLELLQIYKSVVSEPYRAKRKIQDKCRDERCGDKTVVSQGFVAQHLVCRVLFSAFQGRYFGTGACDLRLFECRRPWWEEEQEQMHQRHSNISTSEMT